MMKAINMKYILIILIFIIFSTKVNASSTGITNSIVGFHLGPNYNVLSINSSDYKIEPNFGITYGIHYLISLGIKNVDYPLSGVRYYRSGILLNLDYVNRNNNYTNLNNDIRGSISNNTLQFNVNYIYLRYFRYRYIIYTYSGPAVEYVFENIATNSSGKFLDVDNQLELSIRLGLRINKRIANSLLGIEYNYQHGLTNLNDNFDKIQNRTHNLMLTLKLFAW